MATATVYPYLLLNEKGENPTLRFDSFVQKDYYSKDYKIFRIGLPAMTIDVNLPGEEAIRNACVQLLDAQMIEERAKFHAQQTLMQSVRNNLLRLEHAEVLDAEPKPLHPGTPGEFGEGDDVDDIPF